MKKLFFMLALLASGFWGLTAQAQDVYQVTDTTVADGYYRIHTALANGQYGDSIIGVSLADAASDATEQGEYVLYFRSDSVYNNSTNWNFIWHIYRNSDGSYTMKNCGTQSLTYPLPLHFNGQSEYINCTGRPMTAYRFYTQDYGASSSIGGGGEGDCTREDKAELGRFFIRATMGKWRFRPGGSFRVKCNSKDDTRSASWWFSPVEDLDEKTMALLQLNEIMTDVSGASYSVGVNPGCVSSTDVMDALDEEMANAQSMIDDGSLYTVDQVKAELTKLRAAQQAVEAQLIGIVDGGHYTIATRLQPYWLQTIFNDYDSPSQADNGIPGIDNGEGYYDCPFWFGHQHVTDGITASDGVVYSLNIPACSSNDPAEVSPNYVWRFNAATDSTWYIKNCVEESVAGDSTYYSNVKSNDAWMRFFVKGTPSMQVKMTNGGANIYHMIVANQTNGRHYNAGTRRYTTTWPGNSITYACYLLNTVPESRITAKWRLNEAITDAGGYLVDFIPGDNPGFVKTSLAAPLQSVLAEARTLYAGSPSDADCEAMITKLQAAQATFKAAIGDTLSILNPVEEGYYHIQIATDKFKYFQGSNAYVYATDDGILRWSTQGEDKTDGHQLFKFTKAGDGKWYIQNVQTKQYINSSASLSTEVLLSGTPEEITVTSDYAQQKFENSGSANHDNYNTARMQPSKGYIQIQTANGRCIHPYNHGNGQNTGSYMEGWNTLWFNNNYLIRETDQTLIDSLEAAGVQYALNNNLSRLMDPAEQAKSKTETYDIDFNNPLITNADDADSANCQVSSNAKQMSEGTYAALIDNDPTTYFHSRYNTSGGVKLVDGYHYLQVDLKDKPQQAFRFKWQLRGVAFSSNEGQPQNPRYKLYDGSYSSAYTVDYGHEYRPAEMTIYATNDTADASSWKKVKYIDNWSQDTDIRTYYPSAVVMDQPYRYIRFEMNQNATRHQVNGYPSFAVGELQLYPVTYNSANSPRGYNTAIGTAADALDGYIATAKSELAAGHATQTTIDNLQAAIDAVNAIAPDTIPLTEKLKEAKRLNDSTHVEGDTWIYDPAGIAVTGTYYGDLTSDQKAEFEAAIEAAKAADRPTAHLDAAGVKSAYDALQAAIDKVKAERVQFETNKWYYIKSTERQNYGSNDRQGMTYYPSWRGEQYVYVAGPNTQQPQELGGKQQAYGDEVRWGHYVGFTADDGTLKVPVSGKQGTTLDGYYGGSIDNPNNPYLQWRIVSVGDSLYALQNRATGWYLGRRQDSQGAAGGNAITTSPVPVRLSINLIGRNNYEIMPVDSTSANYASNTDTKPNYSPTGGDIGQPLHLQGADFHMVWWGANTKNEAGCNTGSSFTFVPVEDPLDNDLEFPILDNDTRIMTLPFDIPADGLATASGNMGVYSLKSIKIDEATGKSSLELTDISGQEIKAGQPFILVTGDGAATGKTADDGVGVHAAGVSDSITLYVAPSQTDTYVTEGLTVNGLVGVLDKDTLKTDSFGYFQSDLRQYTLSEATGIYSRYKGKSKLSTGRLRISGQTFSNVFIDGQTGYIDPTKVVDPDPTAAADATITVDGLLNKVKVINAADQAKQRVDVYSVDGKLLKRNVKVSEAQKGLSKGIYIIGKEKVSVR